MRRGFICIAAALLALCIFCAGGRAAEPITLRVTAINPSAEKRQTTDVKKYLPREVTPDDIIDAGGLEVDYDSAKSLYFVYKKDVDLQPKEVRVFEVEINDVWLIADNEISQLRGRTDSALAHLEGSEYYPKAEEIADGIYRRLHEIEVSQTDETLSRQRHIGAYRQNLLKADEVRKDIERLEKALVTAGGPPAPEMLSDTKIKSDSPTKTMTWIVIFSIVVFSGLLAAVLFFTWQRQARITREDISKAKRSAFPESEAGGEKSD